MEPVVYLAIVWLSRPLVKLVAYLGASYRVEVEEAYTDLVHYRHPDVGEYLRGRRFRRVED